MGKNKLSIYVLVVVGVLLVGAFSFWNYYNATMITGQAIAPVPNGPNPKSGCMNNLVGYYDGSDAQDASGNGYHGTIFGDIETVNGKVGQAYVFPGTADTYISVPPEVLAGRDKFSLSFWLLTDDDSGGVVYASSYYLGTRKTELFTGLDGRFLRATWKDGGSRTFKWGTYTHDWRHFIVTFNITDGKAEIRAYVNTKDQISSKGKLMWTQTAVSELIPAEIIVGQERDDAVVGAEEAWSKKALEDRLYKGRIDELAIFEGVLTSEEINYLWNNGEGKSPCN